MKIDGPGSVRSTPAKRSERSQKSGGGSFAKEVDSNRADTAGGVSGAGPVNAIDALLAIQEVEDATSGEANARARRWGHEILDRLEAIRMGLLAGGIPVSQLQNIVNLVSRQREAVSDPRLKELLDEIELRARVEVAKYERDR